MGIAESHAVTFAAGLALGGMVPVFAVYSSFLQRAIDQVLHDVCMQKLHVVFAIDRAGLVGSDGETHNGCFDLSYLSMMPNMTVMAPKNIWELSDMMKYAIHADGPVAVRYPRGEAYDGLQEFRAPIECGKAEVISRGKDVALLALGSMVKTAEQVWKALQEQGKDVTFVNMRFAKPFDRELLDDLAQDHRLMITMEENNQSGGFGEQVSAYLNGKYSQIKVRILAIQDHFVEHGNVEKWKKELGLDAQSVLKIIEDNTR